MDLLKYCKDNNFPISEMNENDFRKVENTVRYKFYELGLKIRKLGREVLKSNGKRENTERKVVKNLRGD